MGTAIMSHNIRINLRKEKKTYRFKYVEILVQNLNGGPGSGGHIVRCSIPVVVLFRAERVYFLKNARVENLEVLLKDMTELLENAVKVSFSRH